MNAVLSITQSEFIDHNKAAFQQLLTFVDFAPERLTIAFVSVSFIPDRDRIIEALKTNPVCSSYQLEVLDFSDPNLRFFLDELSKKLAQIKQERSKKLVLLITGLEESIAPEEYPYVLKDLNYVRDSFTDKVPHPIIFFLPDYAITRIAKFAPDFWAWAPIVLEFHELPQGTHAPTLGVDQIPKALQQQAEQLQKLILKFSDHKKLNTLTIHKRSKELDQLDKNIHALPDSVDSQSLIDKIDKIDQLKQSARQKADKGFIQDAMQLYQDSLKAYISLGNPLITAKVLLDIAEFLVDYKKDLETAKAYLVKAEEIYKQYQPDELHKLLVQYASHPKPSTLTIRNTQQQVAEIYRGVGQEKSDPIFRAVLQSSTVLMPRRADILRWWARLKLELGENDDSLELSQKALEVETKINDLRSEALTLYDIAVLHADRKEFQRAISIINEAIEISKKIGDTDTQAQAFRTSLEKYEEAINKEHLAYREAKEGNREKAIELYQELYDFYDKQTNTDLLVKARILVALASLLIESDQQLGLAEKHLNEANKIYLGEYRSNRRPVQMLLEEVRQKQQKNKKRLGF